MEILKFKKTVSNKSYLAISILGNSVKLNVKYANVSNIELNQKTNEIDLVLPKMYKKYDNIDIINLSVQKLYNKLAIEEIEYSMDLARHILKFAPEDYVIKRLNNEFYKSINKVLYINPDIMQYNRDIINTTILQAFCKIKYKVNSKEYKEVLSNAMKKYGDYKNNNFAFEKKVLRVS